MKGKPGTLAEQARKDALREFGCVACYLAGKPEGERFESMGELHHMLSGNKKIGEAATVVLCYGHHRGPYGWHHNRRAFRMAYGSDMELIETANKLIGWKQWAE